MIEVWGGVECTVARIGGAYRNQLEDTGHAVRLDDLHRIAALGIRTVRYPVLWETVSPGDPREADFTWCDERLARLRDLGIGVIAGLCHHGSGPAGTDLLDPAWPYLLAAHARRVAERYPHVEAYTPVNEPLTTARFSGLYGHWYPHERSYRAFLRALVHQCKATVLAMREIRRVRPEARLVQTDDLGKTFSTPLLAYQANHENQRRWLSFDLLCGQVDRDHPWWPILVRHGVEEADLDLLLEGEGRPDVLGINHYLTSERYLDEAAHRYPEALRGGNGRHSYADAEAVRMPIPHADLGPAARLREAWQRYRLPVAVTEVHHGCSRDDQLRWLMEVWNAARTVAAEGADVRAVTVWALFGTLDWNSLLTRRDGFYEPGPFDVRGAAPRPTVLAHATRSLATGATFDHPVLDRAGWWKRQERFYRNVHRGPSTCRLVGSPREILVVGAGGTLGQAFSRICNARGLDHALVGRPDVDVADRASVDLVLRRVRPWAVVNATGYVRADATADEEAACRRANTDGAAIVAEACAREGLPLLTFSSDLVFDGTRDTPYTEDDAVSPATVYGRSKADAERLVAAAHPDALVIRTSAFFGPWDRYNLLGMALRDLAAGQPVELPPAIVSPTYVPDLVHESLNLLIDGASGLWHLANGGRASWEDVVREAARLAGIDAAGLRTRAGPARQTALDTVRGRLLPPLESAIARFVHEAEGPWAVTDPVPAAPERRAAGA
ncbi:family 1 glycosylhydrolase [Alsobacter sp. R-9]